MFKITQFANKMCSAKWKCIVLEHEKLCIMQFAIITLIRSNKDNTYHVN